MDRQQKKASFEMNSLRIQSCTIRMEKISCCWDWMFFRNIGDRGLQKKSCFDICREKLQEEESQDVILQWESIIGKPAQPVAKIDEAALLAHEHDNKSLLDSLDKDENGRLTIGGKPVDDGKRDTVTISSLGEELPATLRDGGLLILIQEEE